MVKYVEFYHQSVLLLQDMVVVQTLPMLVSIPGSRISSSESSASDVSCGSRHTVVLTKDNHLWAFGEC